MTTPTPDPDTRRARELVAIDYALPGSGVERMMRCGSPRCTHCKADPPELHGPYGCRKVDGKTASKLLTPARLAEL